MKKRYLSLTGLTFVTISLAGFSLFFLIPFFISIALSFSKSSGRFQFVGIANYAYLFQSGSFRLAFLNTIRFIAIGVPYLMLFSVAMAFLFHYLNRIDEKKTSPLFVASLLPMVIPSSAIVMFIEVLFEKYGVINGVLVELGREPVNWMNSGNAAIILLGLYIWKNYSYNMVILLGAIKGIQKEVYEAAALDGAAGWKLTRYIVLPQITSFLSFTLLLSVMGIFKMYRESYLLFGDYPDESIYMLQNFMNNNFYSINYQRLSAASILFFLLVGFSVFLLVRQKVEADPGFGKHRQRRRRK